MVASVFFVVLYKTVKTVRGYVKCTLCGKQKSLTKLRLQIAILQGFYQRQPTYGNLLATMLGKNVAGNLKEDLLWAPAI